MTDLIITDVGDAWVYSGKTGLNTGSAAWVQVKSGERYGFVRPALQSISGLTVTSAWLVGRVGPGHVAQTYTTAPVTEGWSPGRVTWANQPAVDAGAAETTPVSALADGGEVWIDVTSILASVAAGTRWRGLRITTNSTADGQKFYATDSGEPAWELHVSLSDIMEQPTNLRPNAGAVATSTPILAWDPADLGGDFAEQAAFKVQVDTPAAGVDPDDVTPDFETTWQTSADPQFDLDTSTHTPDAGKRTYWRVMTRDAGGEEPKWSDWAWYDVAALPTVVVDSPTGAFGDPTPTILAHTVEDVEQTWWLWITGADRSDIRAESGLQTGDIAWDVPLKNKDGRRVLSEDEIGWAKLRVADDTTRAVAVGQSPYVDTWIPLEFDDDLGVQAPTYLTVFQRDEASPFLTWRWQRPEAADAWLLQVDERDVPLSTPFEGVTVARLEAEDITENVAGTYTYEDRGIVSPLRGHRLAVRAVEGDARSEPYVIRHSHTVEGVWLLPDGWATADAFLFDGTAVGSFFRTDRVATYTPLEGPEIDVIYDYVGRTGMFDGSIDSRQDVWAALGRIETFRKSANRLARMMWGTQAITVRVADIDATSAEDITETNMLHNVRFRFVEVGD